MIFSVIIPTYNRKTKILKCLKSLYAQDFPKEKYEIIVVDDCSTDGTYQYISKQPVNLLRSDVRLGPSAARNYGVSKAKGKYVVFTDSDCEVPKDWLNLILEAYKKYPNVVGVGGGIKNASKSIFGMYENHIYKSYTRTNAEYISAERNELPFALGNMSYVRDFFSDLGGFNEKIPFYCSGEDANLKERVLRRRKKLLYIPLYVMHNHDFSFGNFINQSLERGAGMLLHTKMKGKMQTPLQILLRFVAFPLYIFYSIFKLKFNPFLVFCDTSFYLLRNLGKLKFYDAVSSLKI